MSASLAPAQTQSLEQRLEQRVQANPHDAVGWRLLGRVYEKNRKLPAALQAFQRSVALDATSAAAQADCGRAYLALGQPDQAAPHLVWAVRLAPDSEQGGYARSQLELHKPEWATRVKAEVGTIVPVDFEVPWAVTPQPDLPDPTPLAATESDQQFFFRLESGVLFNSNVELTPISRGLPSSELGSFQAFISPDLELRWPQAGDWQLGTLFSGYFNFNDADREEFNLAHYQPGFYLERLWQNGDVEWAPRVQYDFAYDAFDGHTFGTRHAITTSLARRKAQSRESLVYWTIDYSDFDDDGFVPSLSSLDGWTNTLGTTYTWYRSDRWLSALRTGVDGQWANLIGRDFTYAGIFLFGEAEASLAWNSVLVTKLGWGYRDYYEFTGAPSRNESIWHAGADWRKWLSDHWYVSLSGKYDLFDSQNVDYESDRFTAGASITFER